MKLNEILDSGLLELYVLGKLTGTELREVEQAIQKFPEIKPELFEIEKALFRYDNLYKVTPAAHNIKKIMSQVEGSNSSDNSGNKGSDTKDGKGGSSKWGFLSSLLSLLLLGSLYFSYTKQKDADLVIEDQAKLIEDCEEQKSQFEARRDMYAALLDLETTKIKAGPTDKYPETDMVIHSNPTLQKNYIQLNTLPPLADNQSYQLWSLKGDNPPVPMDVFEGSTEEFLEVGFIDGTNAYAITIEQRGGATSPNLENLIGVFSI